jgi:UDP-N-acetyl-D-galactosamine dehydrogenase
MNELSVIFDKMGLRTKDVLDAAGTKWNFLRFSPGLVGGHCIGVDPYYLTTKAQQLGYNPQVILAGRRINDDMGRFIAQRAVKLMINAGISPAGARVGVLGVTFKENVSDTRNSRVPDIVREFKEFGINVLVHDPIADPLHVKEEYGVDLSPREALHNLDALVVAVAHESFMTQAVSDLCGMVKKDGVFVDVKSIFQPGSVRNDLVYWSL